MSDMGGHQQFAREWLTLQDLADLKLPGLPRGKQHIAQYSREQHWARRTATASGEPLSREREGRGKAVEFHYSVLPAPAQTALIKRGLVASKNASVLPVAANDAQPNPREAMWAAYEAKGKKAKDAAAERLLVICKVEALMIGGWTQTAAIAKIALDTSWSKNAILGWITTVRGVAKCDRLPKLAPNYVPGGKSAEIPAALWTYYESWWLRKSLPSYADTYRRTQKQAEKLGLTLPCEKTFERRAEKIDKLLVLRMRHGDEAVRREAIPAQKRTVKDMHALRLVNIDGHSWDVEVIFPDGTRGRPMMVAIQDVYSRKYLAWRIGKVESAEQVRLVFADLFRTWGIPEACLCDNGRAFASKWITGGVDNRYRFTINPDDPLGLLPSLDITVHWAKPRRGQSKPIERGFGDFAGTAAKHAAFDGAWTGNSVANKPDNRGTKPTDFATFKRVIDAEIAEHNARKKRNTEMGGGKYSFDEVFAASYAQVPIRKATEAQMRLALLMAGQVRANAWGQVQLFGNLYWHEGMAIYAKQKLTLRYDPENLHASVFAYDAKGRFIGEVPVQHAVGFLDREAAVARAKQEAKLQKTARDLERQRGLLSPAQLAEMSFDDPSDIERPQPTVVRPIRLTRGSAAAKVEHNLASTEMLDDFAAKVSHLRLVDNE